jgi:hypothetical protein
MQSQLLDSEKTTLLRRKEELKAELIEAEKDHKQKEKKAQAASHVSMKAYYLCKELTSAIEKIDEALAVLRSATKDQW